MYSRLPCAGRQAKRNAMPSLARLGKTHRVVKVLSIDKEKDESSDSQKGDILARIKKAQAYASKKLQDGELPSPPPPPPTARPLTEPLPPGQVGALPTQADSLKKFTADGTKQSVEDIRARVLAAKKYKNPATEPVSSAASPPPAPPASDSDADSAAATPIEPQVLSAADPRLETDIQRRMQQSAKSFAEAEAAALREAGLVFTALPSTTPVAPPPVAPTPPPPVASTASADEQPPVAAPTPVDLATERSSSENGAGNAEQAAGFLQDVFQKDSAADLIAVTGLDPAAMSMEEYSRRLEEWKRRNTKVEFISKDKEYKPTVATWGVFPRPKDISAAFGGGRNLRPGAPLETTDEAKARIERTKAKLAQYRNEVGLEVDPEAEREARVLYDEGMKLMEAGQLRFAAERFRAATEKVALKTRVGGEATLQRAIALDSMGYNDEAKAMYKTIANHPAFSVMKRSRQMLEGFEAAEFLQADKISYMPPAKEWEPFFLEFASKAPKYVKSAADEQLEETGLNARIENLVAVSVIMFPLAFIAYIVTGKMGHY